MLISSDPSANFRTRVNVPSAAKQFGSFFICLPYPHERGQLRVTHQGPETKFVGSQKEADKIHWIASYNDYEHEGLEVQNDHRVTLTYILYACERLGGIENSAVSPDHDTLNNIIVTVSNSPIHDWRWHPRVPLQVYIRLYQPKSPQQPPICSQGVVAMVFLIFYHVRLDVQVRPVMKGLPDDRYLECLVLATQLKMLVPGVSALDSRTPLFGTK